MNIRCYVLLFSPGVNRYRDNLTFHVTRVLANSNSKLLKLLSPYFIPLKLRRFIKYNYYIFLFCRYKFDNEFNIECNTLKEKKNEHSLYSIYTLHKKHLKQI